MRELYFDRREQQWKSIPQCGRHGLVFNRQSQRCEKIQGLGYVNEYYDTGLYLDGGGYDYGYYEPYYEPVYYEPPPAPVYEPPPAPAPAPTPEPVYVAPEPVYQPTPEPVYYAPAPAPTYKPAPEPVYYEPAPIYEPTYNTGLWLAPGQSYEPVYQYEPVSYFEPAPYVEPYKQTFEPTYESPPYIPPIEAVAYEPAYVAPEPVYLEFEAPDSEYYRLPYVVEPELVYQPTPEPAPAPVSDWAFCANEHQRCNFPDTREVRYGKGSIWTAPRTFTGGVDCSNAVFGDPLYGTVKECQTRVVSQPEPEPFIAEPEPFIAPTFEPVFSEPVKAMDAEDYSDTYFLNGGGGGYYDYGYGGGDYYYEPTYYVPIDYAPIDFAPYEPLPLEPPQLEYVPTFEEFFHDPSWVPEEVPFAPYEPLPLEPPTFEPISVGSDDLFLDYLSYYLGQGYDDATATTLADQGAATGVAAPIVFETYTPYLPEAPALPDLPPMTFPYVPSPYDPWAQWMTPPTIPPIPEPIPPAPPAQKLGPCDTPDGLPGPCAGGFYHPMDNPCACVPFPPAPAPAPAPQQPPSQTPRPSTPTPTPAPRPPTQQQQQPCPTGYCKHPTTGQCMPIPQGYQRHPQTQVCTAQTPQVSPLPIPSEAEDMFADLKKLPWWVWAGLAGVVVLSRGGRR